MGTLFDYRKKGSFMRKLRSGLKINLKMSETETGPTYNAWLIEANY